MLCLSAGAVLESQGLSGMPTPPPRRFLVSISEILAWSPGMTDPGAAVAAAAASASGSGTALDLALLKHPGVELLCHAKNWPR